MLTSQTVLADLRRAPFASRLAPLPENYEPSPYGVVVSAFDMLHAGHVLMLQDAMRRAHYLFVGLHTDPSTADPSYRGKRKNSPIQDLEMCYIQLEALVRGRGEIFIYDTEEDLLACLKKIARIGPHVRILGSDWRGKTVTGQYLATEVYYHERNHEWSSTWLRERLANTLQHAQAA